MIREQGRERWRESPSHCSRQWLLPLIAFVTSACSTSALIGVDEAPLLNSDVSLENCRVTSKNGALPQEIVPICCSPSEADEAIDGQLAIAMNTERFRRDIPQLERDFDLEEVAQAQVLHALLHGAALQTFPEASVATLEDRARQCDTVADAQLTTILLGPEPAPDRDAVRSSVAAWLDDAEHRAVVIDETYSRLGIGYHLGYFAAIFGR